MDIVTILLSIVASAGTGALAAGWLAKRIMDHGLQLHLAQHKASLDEQLTRVKAALDAESANSRAMLEASLRRANDIFVGDEAAERSYRFEARKRLYTAVGPLRFQLMGACTQYLTRMQSIAVHRFDVSTSRYFGKSILFRVGRLLALTELVERQTVYADFSVDPAMIQLLRFRAQVLRALSSDDVVVGHPGADWTKQKEHVFRDQLPIVAISMIVDENGAERVIRFDEFGVLLDKGGGYLEPLRSMVERLDPTATPIFWLRLLAIAKACEALIEGDSVASSMDPPTMDHDALLAACRDEHVRAHIDEVKAVLGRFRTRVLTTQPPAIM